MPSWHSSRAFTEVPAGTHDRPGRALASSMSGSPHQGPGTGFTPPISTSVPGTPGSFLRNSPTSNPARVPTPYPGWGILVIGSEEKSVIRPVAPAKTAVSSPKTDPSQGKGVSREVLTLNAPTKISAAAIEHGIKLGVGCGRPCTVQIVASVSRTGAARASIYGRSISRPKADRSVRIILRLSATGHVWARTRKATWLRITAQNGLGRVVSKVIWITHSRPRR
jgi:hypothetical protein